MSFRLIFHTLTWFVFIKYVFLNHQIIFYVHIKISFYDWFSVSLRRFFVKNIRIITSTIPMKWNYVWSPHFDGTKLSSYSFNDGHMINYQPKITVDIGMNLHLLSLEIDIKLCLLQFHGGSYRILRARAAHKAINYANRSFLTKLIARRYLHCLFNTRPTQTQEQIN